MLSLQLIQRITGSAQVLRQGLSESLVEGGMFHVDHNAVDILASYLFRDAVGFVLRGHARHRNVPCTIRKQDEQWKDIRVEGFFTDDGLVGEVETGREGRFAAYGDLDQRPAGELNGVGRGKDHRGAILLKDN
jgi:hypothetical protein